MPHGRIKIVLTTAGRADNYLCALSVHSLDGIKIQYWKRVNFKKLHTETAFYSKNIHSMPYSI